MDASSNISKQSTVMLRETSPPERRVIHKSTEAAESGCFTLAHLQRYLYGYKKVQLIDTTKLQKERIKGLHISKELKGTSWCDICNENPEQCPMHGSLHSLRKLVNQSQVNSPIDYSAILKFPDEVGLCTSSLPGVEYGVCARTAIPSGTWIGPYEGRLVRPEEIKTSTTTEYMWEIFHDGQVSHYLDARDDSNSSWMRFIRCARQRFEQNMVIFQYHGCIYYRTTKDVKNGEELLVWYDSRYTQIFGIPVALNESGNRGVNPPKGIVTQERTFGKRRLGEPEGPNRMIAENEGSKRMIMENERHKRIIAGNEGSKRIIMENEGPKRIIADNEGSRKIIAENEGPKRIIADNDRSRRIIAERSIVVKQETEEPVREEKPDTIPQSAFNYRNSLYHRGRWYTITSDERLKQGLPGTTRNKPGLPGTRMKQGLPGAMRTKVERKEHCKKCLNSFSSRASLLDHNCVDTAVTRNYTCAYCDVTCTTLAELGKHVEDHVNERPYQCSYCTCAFNNSAALNQHVRIHSVFKTSNIAMTHGIDQQRV